MRHEGEPRWELDPASAEDYEERTRELDEPPGERFRQWLIVVTPLAALSEQLRGANGTRRPARSRAAG